MASKIFDKMKIILQMFNGCLTRAMIHEYKKTCLVRMSIFLCCFHVFYILKYIFNIEFMLRFKCYLVYSVHVYLC